MVLNFWGNKLWHRFKNNIQMFHNRCFWVGLYWYKLTAGNGCARTGVKICRKSYIIFKLMYCIARQSSSSKKKKLAGKCPFTFSIAMNSCNLDLSKMILETILLRCELGKGLCMALAQSLCVKTEAQRWVQPSAVLEPARAKKFYLCKFFIVNTSW